MTDKLAGEIKHTPSVHDALESAKTWLSNWAVHAGRCKGGNACTCGLTAIRAEVEFALAAPAPSARMDGTPYEAALFRIQALREALSDITTTHASQPGGQHAVHMCALNALEVDDERAALSKARGEQ